MGVCLINIYEEQNLSTGIPVLEVSPMGGSSLEKPALEEGYVVEAARRTGNQKNVKNILWNNVGHV